MTHSGIRNFVQRIRDNQRMKEAGLAEVKDLPNLQHITLGPSDHPPFFNTGEEKLDLVVAGDVFEASASSSKLKKLNMTIGFADLDYGLEDANDQTEMNELDRLLSAFKSATTASNWCFVVFCSFRMLEDVRTELGKVCHLGVDYHFWIKENVQRNVNAQRSTNVVECFAIGHCGPGPKRAALQCMFGDDKIAANAHVCGKVQKAYYYQGKVSNDCCRILFFAKSF